MQIKVGFNNPNTTADGINVYRSKTTPLDVSALPAPLATIDPASTSYTDTTVEKDQTYYYIFEVFKGVDKVRTANIKATAVFYTGPGNQTLKSGDLSAGYYGIVSAADFIEWDALVLQLGVTLAQKSTTTIQEWLKFVYKGKVLFIPKQPLGTVAWISLYTKGLVYGVDGPGPREYNTQVATNQLKTVTIGGSQFKVRLMRGLPEGADLTRPYTATQNTAAVAAPAGGFTPDSYDSIYELTGSEWNDLLMRCMTWTPSTQKGHNWDRLENAMAFNGITSYTGWNGDNLMMEMVSTGQIISRGKVSTSVHPGYCYSNSNSSAYQWWPVLEML